MAVAKTTKLTLYLFKEDVTDLDDVIRPSYLRGDRAVEVVEPSTPLPYEARAYALRNQGSQPKWVRTLAGHFDVDDLHNVTSSFVLAFKAGGRVWALPFGFGHNALERSCVEPGFGLKVCANSLNAASLKTVDVRTVDVVTRQQRTRVSAGSRLAELGVRIDQDWVRYLAGTPTSAELARSLAGSDSVALNTDCPLAELPAKCEALLERFSSDDYKANFGFIDHLRPLRKDDPVVTDLNQALTERMASGSTDRVAVAPPDILDEVRLTAFTLKGAGVNDEADELDLATVYGVLDDRDDVELVLDKVRVTPVNDEGAPIGTSHRLRDYLVCEIEQDGQLFVLSAGEWFEVDADHVADVNAEVREIPNVTDDLALPPMRPGEAEGAYNLRAATERGWTCLDAKPIKVGGPYQKVELCDLLSPQQDLVCVKKLTSSATLSHLFNQGSVSAQLLGRDPDFRRHAAALATQQGGQLGTLDKLRFVFAVATGKPGDIADTLFFFSKMALIASKRDIEERRFKVGIARIAYEGAADD